MTYTDQEIYDNRVKAIEQLLDPSSRKAIGKLEDGRHENTRCCLGHFCHVLIPEKRSIDILYDDNGDVNLINIDYGDGTAFPPDSIMEMLGLYDRDGSCGDRGNFDPTNIMGTTCTSLAGVNDGTDKTPQEIGEYLLANIMGGINTPFRPIMI